MDDARCSNKCGDAGPMKTLSLRQQDLDWRQIGDEIVALDAQGAAYLGLRGSGAVLWRLLADSATWEEIVAALVKTYGIDPTQAAEDVGRFLAALSERGLLAS